MKRVVQYLCVLVFVVSIILNISLISSKYQKAKYVYKIDDFRTCEITFYDNTFEYIQKEGQYYIHHIAGFVKYRPNNSIIFNDEDNGNYDCLLLDDLGVFKRKNIFVIENSTGDKFICAKAIFLEVIYILSSIFSLVLFFIIDKKSKDT